MQIWIQSSLLFSKSSFWRNRNRLVNGWHFNVKWISNPELHAVWFQFSHVYCNIAKLFVQFETREIHDFLRDKAWQVLLDVRSPSEYKQGHIPGALSFPLFSDEDRHVVGLTYKREGTKAATKLGLQIASSKIIDFVDGAEKLAGNKPIGMYCWRGGMRSQGMALLLATAGMKVTVLKKGYKTYRNWALQQFERPYKLINLGGYTGTGKTTILLALAKKGLHVIDLEGLAKHRGSAFGNLEQNKQPTSEQFENELAIELAQLGTERPIFIEDESRNIGMVNLPNKLYRQLRQAPLIFLQKDKEVRIEYLKPVYGAADKTQAKKAFERIKKRLGGNNLKLAWAAIDANDAEKAIDIALNYYDRYYYKGLEKRSFSRMVKLDTNRPLDELIAELQQIAKKLYPDA
jgi:tRNA 2-selenouridine synthase